jgi:hypothetical protein
MLFTSRWRSPDPIRVSLLPIDLLDIFTFSLSAFNLLRSHHIFLEQRMLNPGETAPCSCWHVKVTIRHIATVMLLARMWEVNT